MTAIDFVLLAIIVVSGMISLIRGFIRESLSLVTWVAAIWIAIMFHGEVSPYFAEQIPDQTLRDIAGFAALFIGVVLAGGLVGLIISMLVATSGLTGTDRALGVVFGLARGVVVSAVVVMLAGQTAVTSSQPWDDSQLRPYLQPVADWLYRYMPETSPEELMDSARDIIPDT
jgi:membrane protein required for colicin V production